MRASGAKREPARAAVLIVALLTLRGNVSGQSGSGTGRNFGDPALEQLSNIVVSTVV